MLTLMLHIAIIVGWVVAAGLVLHLSVRAIRYRLWGRQRRKHALRKLRAFRRRHHFDEKQQRWIRKIDGVALVDEPNEDRRFMLAGFALLLFVLWEGYWLLEVVERFSKSTHPWQLPYMFLFVIMVVIPLAGYLFVRRLMRRSARVPFVP